VVRKGGLFAEHCMEAAVLVTVCCHLSTYVIECDDTRMFYPRW